MLMLITQIGKNCSEMLSWISNIHTVLEIKYLILICMSISFQIHKVFEIDKFKISFDIIRSESFQYLNELLS